MTSLFPEETHRTGEETEKFNALLEPIIEQMETLSFHKSQRLSVVFSLFSGLARMSCKGLRLHSMTLEERLPEVCKKCSLWQQSARPRRSLLEFCNV